MKASYKLVVLLITIAIAIVACVLPVHAQDAVGITVPPEAANFVLNFALSHPVVGTILIVMGIMRVLFKPIMTAVENAVANDPAKLAAVQKFEGGLIFKIISWVLDFGASIKVPHIVVATTVPKS